MQFWLPGKVEWKQLQYGDSCYIHAIPWLALLILLLRNLAQLSLIFAAVWLCDT